MNIWYFKHYAGGPGFGKATRAYHLGRAWNEAGHQTTVFVARYHHVLDRPEPLPAEMDCDGVRYISLPARIYASNGIGRLMNTFDYCRAMFGVDRRKDIGRPDVVIVSSPHPFGIFPGAWLARRFGAKLVFEVRDLWPLSITELTGMHRLHPFVLLAGIAERFGYRRSDRVASLLGGALPHMTGKGMAAGKFLFVPNGLTGDEATGSTGVPTETARLAERRIAEWHAEGRVVAIHPGAQGRPNALDRLLDAIAIVNREGAGGDLGVMLLGEGEETAALKRQASELGLPNVAFFANVPKADAIRLTAQCDIGYAGARNVERLYRYGISFNKIGDFLQAGIPIILPLQAAGDAVSASGGGIVTGDDSPQAIAEALMRMIAMGPEARREMGAKGLRYARTALDYRKIAADYVGSIESA